MATRPKNIFTRSKPLLNIYSGVDHEGKQVQYLIVAMLKTGVLGA